MEAAPVWLSTEFGISNGCDMAVQRAWAPRLARPGQGGVIRQRMGPVEGFSATTWDHPVDRNWTSGVARRLSASSRFDLPSRATGVRREGVPGGVSDRDP